MKEHPILFSGPMVRAILDGRKTQTRRIVRGVDASWGGNVVDANGELVPPECKLYGKPGDRLWVRETWRLVGWSFDDMTGVVEYADGVKRVADIESDECWLDNYLTRVAKLPGVFDVSDGTYDGYITWDDPCPLPWKPSIHMPRWASRIVLEVTAVRVERVQNIPFYDIRAEGFDCPVHDFDGEFCCSECDSLRVTFAEAWNTINAKRSPWSNNPWVWVIEFRRV